MSHYNPHTYHPHLTPFNTVPPTSSYYQPQPIITEYTGSNPWEYFHYLENLGQLDEYWVAWAREQGYYGPSGGIGSHHHQVGVVGKYVPPPSIGRGPRVVNQASRVRVGSVHGHGQNNPGQVKKPLLTQIAQSKRLEHTAALISGRPLDMNKVLPSRVVLAVTGATSTATAGTGGQAVVGMKNLEGQGRARIHGQSDGHGQGQESNPSTTVPPALPSSIPPMHLSPDQAPIYRIGQRGVSNEYLRTILRPPDSPSTPSHPLSTTTPATPTPTTTTTTTTTAAAETWNTPSGRVKMYQLADMVFQFKVGREQALGRKGQEGREVAGVDGHDDEYEDEVVGVEDEGMILDDHDHQSIRWDEDELWPVLLDKELKDL